MKTAVVTVVLLALAACGSPPLSIAEPDTAREHDLRFVGKWAVEVLSNAQFWATFYDFAADGALTVGGSTAGTCADDSQACTTAFVHNCGRGQDNCSWSESCEFGSEWHSIGPAHLMVEASCSSGLTREILIGFGEDSTTNSTGGNNATLLAVDNDPDWMFPGNTRAFLKCPDGANEAACADELRLF